MVYYLQQKLNPCNPLFCAFNVLYGGEGGIRTLEASLHSPNRLAGGPFQPLKHLSPLHRNDRYDDKISMIANNIITDFIKKSLHCFYIVLV